MIEIDTYMYSFNQSYLLNNVAALTDFNSITESSNESEGSQSNYSQSNENERLQSNESEGSKLDENEGSQSNIGHEEVKLAEKNKTPCIWNEDSINSFLDFLKERKEVLQLESRGSIASEVKKILWDDASSMLNNQYTSYQCAVKWKNMKQTYTVKFISLISKLTFIFNKLNCLI